MDKSVKKQMVLRLDQRLYDALAKWADDEFRSINAQIEFLLTSAVKKRKSTDKDE